MADISTPSAEYLAKWKEWIASRPLVIQQLTERFVPWKLYRLESTGHRVLVIGYSERNDGPPTLIVAVTGKYNFVTIERRVFGINPEELTECDLPSPEEKVGRIYAPGSDGELAHINKMRLALGNEPLTREQFEAEKGK